VRGELVIVICNRKTKECSIFADMKEYTYKGDYVLFQVDQKLQKLLEDDGFEPSREHV